jgi:hypothetical protein
MRANNFVYQHLGWFRKSNNNVSSKKVEIKILRNKKSFDVHKNVKRILLREKLTCDNDPKMEIFYHNLCI